jgi:hypothetical protein
VRDVFWERMLGANTAGVDTASLAGFGERIVAAVEVLAFFEMLGEVVGFGGELAVETEKTLLVGRQRLDRDISKLK